MSNFADYDFAPVCDLISRAERILVAGHISPDGDCLGSALALAQGLKYLGKQPIVVFQDEAPKHLQFLPGADEIISPGELAELINKEPVMRLDLLILEDCATLDRTGDGWLNEYLAEAPLVILDHHALRDDIPAVSIIDAKLAATGELIYWLLQALQVPLTVDIARCLYTAICTDTGGFRFTNTRTHTFEIAAKLRAMGISLEEMRIQLFESRSFEHIKVLGAAMNNMEKSADNRLVWCWLDAETKRRLNAKPEDTDNIAGQTMLVEGVKVGVFFDERVRPDGTVVKVSFRGRNGYNVGALAAQFGGGGHHAASGATLNGDLAEVMPKVLAAAEELLAEMAKKA